MDRGNNSILYIIFDNGLSLQVLRKPASGTDSFRRVSQIPSGTAKTTALRHRSKGDARTTKLHLDPSPKSDVQRSATKMGGQDFKTTGVAKPTAVGHTAKAETHGSLAEALTTVPSIRFGLGEVPGRGKIFIYFIRCAYYV